LRSERGSFTSKVKDAIFFYFGESSLPRINTADPPVDILKWKKKPAIAKCYYQLFSNHHKALVEIVDKVFGEKNYSNLQMAYVISICITILNPKNKHIKCQENVMKKKIHYYLVSFIVFFYFVV
jgi:hypothetical protein